MDPLVTLVSFLGMVSSFPVPLREPLGIVEAPCLAGVFFWFSFLSWSAQWVELWTCLNFWGLFPKIDLSLSRLSVVSRCPLFVLFKGPFPFFFSSFTSSSITWSFP